jgi:hypothetical protein
MNNPGYIIFYDCKLRRSVLLVAFEKTQKSAPEGRPVLLVTWANPDLFMRAGFETILRHTTLEKSAIPNYSMHGKTVRLNTPEIRSMDETHVRRDPSDPLDREKTLNFNPEYSLDFSIWETGIIRIFLHSTFQSRPFHFKMDAYFLATIL